METSFPNCPMCGFVHPPIKSGESCPLAKKINKATGNEIDISKFVNMIKNVIECQLEKRNIQNIDKFAGKAVVELTKFCESYKE